MSGAFSKSMARNVFFGGTVFFFLLFLALTFDTIKQLPKRDMRQNITPQVAAGKLRALAVSSRERSPQLPGVPTLAETTTPGLDAQGWYGLLAPAGTPLPVLDKLNAGLNKALRDPGVLARLQGLGSTPIPGSRDEFATLLRSEVKRWGDIVVAKKITA